MSSGEEVLELLANDLLSMEDPIGFEEEDLFFDPAIDAVGAETTPNQHFQAVTEEDCNNFIKENENTYFKTKSDLKLFYDWMKSVNEDRNLEDIPPQELDVLLARFCLAVRKRDGSEYEPGTLTTIQYSIDRYLKEKRVNFSIRKGEMFSHSNQVLTSKRKNLKVQGKGNLKSRAEPLTKEEFKILRERKLLGTEDGQTLLQTVWLNNGVYFGMRGRQDHTNLLWGDIELKKTVANHEYLEFTERSTKTRNGSSRNCNREVLPKLFATPSEELCPVAVYKEYKRRRPADMLCADSRFYLTPISNPKSEVWFSHQPVGKNKLGQIMKTLADKGQLEGRKSNHSTRKTFAQTLVQAGRPPTEIAHLGGWKNVQTINAYSKPTLDQQAKASAIISDLINPSSSTAVLPYAVTSVQTNNQTAVLTDVTPCTNTTTSTTYSNTLDASRNVMSKQHSNPFAVLCGANISVGTFNINIVSGKRKFSDIDSSQE